MTTLAISPFLGSSARDLGYTPTRLRQAVREGGVRRVLRNVYVDGGIADSTDLRVAALHLVMPPHAVLFGTTAMWALSIDGHQPEERYVPVPRCVVPHHQSRVVTSGVQTVEGYVPAADVMEYRGLRMTNPVRTTVDIMRRLRRPFAMSGADAMAHAGWVQKYELEERVHQLRGYPGIVQARSLVRLVDPNTDWPGESWTKLRLCDCGLPLPRAQIPVVDVRGRTAYLDLGYEHAKVGCEYDGREAHTLDEDTDADDERRGWLREALDWRIAIARKETVFTREPSFELEVAAWLGIAPQLPRMW